MSDAAIPLTLNKLEDMISHVGSAAAVMEVVMDMLNHCRVKDGRAQDFITFRLTDWQERALFAAKSDLCGLVRALDERFESHRGPLE